MNWYALQELPWHAYTHSNITFLGASRSMLATDKFSASVIKKGTIKEETKKWLLSSKVFKNEKNDTNFRQIWWILKKYVFYCRWTVCCRMNWKSWLYAAVVIWHLMTLMLNQSCFHAATTSVSSASVRFSSKVKSFIVFTAGNVRSFHNLIWSPRACPHTMPSSIFHKTWSTLRQKKSLTPTKINFRRRTYQIAWRARYGRMRTA